MLGVRLTSSFLGELKGILKECVFKRLDWIRPLDGESGRFLALLILK